MARRSFNKLQVLECRHPGLRLQMTTMFAELWPAPAVKHMLESQYGERLSLRSVERYKSKQWQAQRECIQQASAALAAWQGPAGCLGVR